MEAAAFLRAISDPARLAIVARTVLVFAHPDDETLACGALLPRLQEVRVVHVTDGAPRTGDDARRFGFAGPSEYAAARHAELRLAMRMAGVGEDRLTSVNLPDQGAAFALAELARRLASLLDGAEIAVTHAYEGGHPDHDAVCWGVHAAARMLGRRGRAPALVEVPLYRLGPDGNWERQSFAGRGTGTDLRLGKGERELKRRMLAAHASQAETLASFGVTDEPYRAAPAYDFSQLPNCGGLIYEQYGWDLTGARWLELVRAAERDLGLERAA